MICTVHFWLTFRRLVRKFVIKCDILSTKGETLYYCTNKFSITKNFLLVSYITIKCYCLPMTFIILLYYLFCYAVCSISKRSVINCKLYFFFANREKKFYSHLFAKVASLIVQFPKICVFTNILANLKLRK